MSGKAGEPLCCSQACWATPDFNTNQSSPQHEWKLQCCFFTSCSFFRGVWVICCVYRDIVPHPSGLQQLLVGVQKCNQGHKTTGAHAGRVNQKAGITALGSWPETLGWKNEPSNWATETLCGSHQQDVCFPSPPWDRTSSRSFPS